MMGMPTRIAEAICNADDSPVTTFIVRYDFEQSRRLYFVGKNKINATQNHSLNYDDRDSVQSIFFISILWHTMVRDGIIGIEKAESRPQVRHFKYYNGLGTCD